MLGSSSSAKQSSIQVCMKKQAVGSCELSSVFFSSFHVVICLETHWLSCFPADLERERWTKTFADCGIYLVCAFHLVHRAVLHFAYFCSARPLSLVYINLTAAWLSTDWPSFCVYGVCVCVCVSGIMAAIRRGGGVAVFHPRFCNANEHKKHKTGSAFGFFLCENHPKDTFLWIQNRIICETATCAPALNGDIIQNFSSPQETARLCADY